MKKIIILCSVLLKRHFTQSYQLQTSSALLKRNRFGRFDTNNDLMDPNDFLAYFKYPL